MSVISDRADILCTSGQKLQPQAAATSRRPLRGPAARREEDGPSRNEPQAALRGKTAKVKRTQAEPVVKKQSGNVSPLSSVFNLYSYYKDYVRHFVIFSMTAAAVLMACSLRGDVALVAILLYKSYMGTLGNRDTPTNTINNTNETIIQGQHSLFPNAPQAYEPILPDYLQIPDSYNLKDLLFYLGIGIGSSQLMYHGICGFLQLYYYILQRDEPNKWKCQPHRFLTRSNEVHEMVVGTVNMTLAGGISGFLTCWIVNGNYSTVYFDISEYGYLYFLFTVVFLFLWFEAGAYYSHALLHTPWFYKNCHKQHHRYHSPTAYSVIAMSPFELAFYDSLMVAPLFVFPIHGFVYVVELVYIYYFGLMDHSGIKMVSWFPWQPDTMFHDDHHKFFHVNFGFNSYIFDWIHGTLRDNSREYGEDIFGGKGRVKKE